MCTHCREIWIYVFPKKELRGLSPNFHIHVSVSDLYIPTFGPPIFIQQNKQTDQRNILISHRNMNVLIGTGKSFPGNICFEFSVLCLCSAGIKYPHSGVCRIKRRCVGSRGFQRDVVYLCWSIASSVLVYEPSRGRAGGELRGLSQRVQLYTEAHINFGRSNSIFNL